MDGMVSKKTLARLTLIVLSGEAGTNEPIMTKYYRVRSDRYTTITRVSQRCHGYMF